MNSACQPLLQMRGISKRFGATQALQGVDLELYPGQVLALIGENGAGKSTLMKILSGAYEPDQGQMFLQGRPYRPSGPAEALDAGVAMIYQELNLAPDLSVEDNIMLGQEERRGGWWLARTAARKRIAQVLYQLGHADLDPRTPVHRLPLGAQQVVEIARALIRQVRVLVLDEPTSSLPAADVQRLFEVLRRLKQTGVGVIYISHFLEEVQQIADRYLVLRDGRAVGQGKLSQTTHAQLVALMAGRQVEELFPQVPHAPGEVILRVEGLQGERMPRWAEFELRRGEILGIAGLVGAGRTELLRCLYGLDPVRSGRVQVAQFSPPPNPAQRIRAGLGFVCEDRKAEGLTLDQSLEDNLTYTRMQPYRRWGFLLRRRRRACVQQWIERLGIKTRGPTQPVYQLSGGNQQKVAFGRVLHQEADVYLLDEPTRGIDVATKAELYRWMGQLAAEGKAVVFVSSYLQELLAVCDRIAVMYRGRLSAPRPAQQWTEDTLLAAALGALEQENYPQDDSSHL